MYLSASGIVRLLPVVLPTVTCLPPIEVTDERPSSRTLTRDVSKVGAACVVLVVFHDVTGKVLRVVELTLRKGRSVVVDCAMVFVDWTQIQNIINLFSSI